MTKKQKNSNRLAIVLSWGLVLFWMGIIFWFSSQPAEESVQWSVGFMEAGREIIRHWEWVGVIAFIIAYHLFLVWLIRLNTGFITKLCLFLLFLLISIGLVYSLFTIILPRIAASGVLELNRWVIHRYLRKYAHFIIYLFLGSVIKNALYISGIKGWKSIGIAILMAFFYAIFDELHQFFVPGRIPLVLDVVIDTAGATVGILMYTALNHIVRLIK